MINGNTLRDAIISAANNIDNSRKAVDALNVFPVPDGDTGTNMSMTIKAAARELALLPDSSTVGEVSAKAASALLRGARGNSGVILSLIFRGFSKALKGLETADSKALAKALAEGTKAAYGAVIDRMYRARCNCFVCRICWRKSNRRNLFSSSQLFCQYY